MLTFGILFLIWHVLGLPDRQKPSTFNDSLSESDRTRYSNRRDALLEWAQVSKSLDKNTTRLQLGYFAICVIAKNEHAYAREWIQYHLWKGTSKIYLYDNGSNPPMINTILDFVQQGYIDYYYFTHSHEADDFQLKRTVHQSKIKMFAWLDYQKWGYDSCMWNFGHRHKFVGIFDIDEFIVTPNNLSMQIPDFLKDFEGFGGVNVYRRFFGPSGHIQKPNGTVLESYTHCTVDPYSYRQQDLPKQIVNVKYYNGHCFAHYCSTTIPTANTEKVEDTEQNIQDNLYKRTWEGMMINHYFTKSYEELKDKYIKKYSYKPNVTLEDSIQKQQQYFKQVNKHTKPGCDDGIVLSTMCCSELKDIK
eukprot:TRINITY_DN938_c0_g1_i6.p1 TRINITY_DN938_c0_g1~~TRINITY_DN938_c0_g1_i6.p1  ORF type:complete len:394 (+),score=23.11 TRINITY_DN938_c0_g1_i6:102-1184(+)